MDFDLSLEQQQLAASVRTLLERQAGPQRARDVRRDSGYDAPLMKALVEAGFADFADAGAGPLEAVLAVELVAEANGCVPIASRALVAPALLDGPLPNVVALVDNTNPGPVRYAAQADVILATRGDTAERIDPSDVEIRPVESPFGYPMAFIAGAEAVGTPIADRSADDLRRWWRVALAAEMVGCMEGALRRTVSYVSERHQFGRPLGALQSVQHRLAELHLRIEGARWLTRCAAWNGVDGQDAAAAATAAAEAAERAVTETHQLTGAMGLTEEYDLYLWTMQLTALRQELRGKEAHAAALAEERWPGEGARNAAGALT